MLSQTTYAVLILIAALLMVSMFSKNKGQYIEPVVLFYYPWIFVSILQLLSFIEYKEEISILQLAFVLICLLFFGVGTALIPGVKMRRRKKGNEHSAQVVSENTPSYSSISVSIIVGLTILHLMVNLVDIFSLLKSGFSSGLDLEGLRQGHWDSFYQKKYILLDVVESAGRAGSILAATSIFILMKKKKTELIVVSAISWVNLAVEALGQGSRFIFVFLLMSAAISYFALNYKGIRRKKTGLKPSNIFVLIVSGLLFFSILFVWFPMARNPNLKANPQKYLSYMDDAKISGWVNRSAELTKSNVPKVAAYSVNYMTSPDFKLAYFLGNTDIVNWYYFGAYNAPTISKIISLTTSKENTWIEIRNRIKKFMLGKGYSENPWATGLRDLVIDFGLVGSPIILFLFGVIVQRIFNYSISRKDPESIVAISIIGASLVTFKFLSPFVIGSLFNSIVLVIMLHSIKRSSVNSQNSW